MTRKGTYRRGGVVAIVGFALILAFAILLHSNRAYVRHTQLTNDDRTLKSWIGFYTRHAELHRESGSVDRERLCNYRIARLNESLIFLEGNPEFQNPHLIWAVFARIYLGPANEPVIGLDIACLQRGFRPSSIVRIYASDGELIHAAPFMPRNAYSREDRKQLWNTAIRQWNTTFREGKTYGHDATSKSIFSPPGLFLQDLKLSVCDKEGRESNRVPAFIMESVRRPLSQDEQ